jgi:hypothetical protein
MAAGIKVEGVAGKGGDATGKSCKSQQRKYKQNKIKTKRKTNNYNNNNN